MTLQNGFLLGRQLVLPARNEIEGPNGGRIRVPDVAMRILLLLVEAKGATVPHAELRQVTGAAEPISDDRLKDCIHDLRAALGDDSRRPHFIKTLPRRGYRLVCTVSEVEKESGKGEIEHPLMREIRRRRLLRVAGAYLAIAWVILQVVETLEAAVNLPPWISTVTVALLALGLPLAILAAWTLQLTERGVVIDRGDGDPAHGIGWTLLDVGVIGVSVLAFGLILWQLLQPHEPAPPQAYIPIEKSVAVLPLVPSGSNAPDAFFTDGLTEEIISLLALLDGVQVMSRAATFSFRDQQLGLKEIAARLRAQLLVEGSVRRLGDTLRVNVKLVDGPTGVIAWSGEYEGDLTNVTQIQDQIATEVARQMRAVLSHRFKVLLQGRGADQPQVIDLTLRGHGRLRAARTVVDLEKALQHFEEALSLAPGYPQANAGECQVHLALYVMRGALQDFQSAESACARARALAGNKAETSIALGELYLAKGDADKALGNFTAALEDRPKLADAMIGRADALDDLDRKDEATRQFREVIKIEPGYWRAHYRYGRHLYGLACYGQAIEQFEEVLRVRPGDTSVLNSIAAAEYFLGQFGKAAAIWSNLVQSGPPQEAYSNLGTLYYYDGDFAQAIDMYQRAIALTPDIHWFHGAHADALLAAGNAATSVRVYENAIDLARARLNINDSDAKTMSSLAHYLANIGQMAEAIATIDRALTLDAVNPDINYDAALVFVSVGNPDRAITHVATALANGFQKAMIEADPALATLRSNPAFVSTMQKFTATFKTCL